MEEKYVSSVSRADSAPSRHHSGDWSDRFRKNNDALQCSDRNQQAGHQDHHHRRSRGISAAWHQPDSGPRKIGLTFAQSLRSILRHDPDVVLVGEIRDLETAENAIQASLTGHLVFSTLHTNDASGAFTRMVDMGVEPFLVASTVEAIMAQRLVRKLCLECREPYEHYGDEAPSDFPLPTWCGPIYRAKGCRKCRNLGYSGRMGIYELSSPTRKFAPSRTTARAPGRSNRPPFATEWSLCVKTAGRKCSPDSPRRGDFPSDQGRSPDGRAAGDRYRRAELDEWLRVLAGLPAAYRRSRMTPPPFPEFYRAFLKYTGKLRKTTNRKW
jgi:hypothetical protein